MIDFSKFEGKTRGGYDWEIIVPEDGLIRVTVGETKALLVVDAQGETRGGIYPQNPVFSNTECDLVLREEEWRAGWGPSTGGIKYFTANSMKGPSNATWCDDEVDERRAAVGNCYPDTPRGKLLAEARAKYEPLIGEIAGMDEPEEVFSLFRIMDAPLIPSVCQILLDWYPSPARATDLRAAIRWLDSGYRLTIEEAES